MSGTLALWGLGGVNESGSTYFTVGPNWTQLQVALDTTHPECLAVAGVPVGRQPVRLPRRPNQPAGVVQWRFYAGVCGLGVVAGDECGDVFGVGSSGGDHVPAVECGVGVGSVGVSGGAGRGRAPGQSYQGSIWVRAASGATVSGTLALWGLGGVNESGSTYFTVGPNWTQLQVAFDTTRAHSALQLQVYLSGANQFDFLDAQITRTVKANTSRTGTGTYGFEDFPDAAMAIGEGWPGIGSVSGYCTAPSSSYACPTGADPNMSAALTGSNSKDFWLSFWTIGAPVNGDSWYADGFTAGTNAAEELVGLSGRLPTFEVLDPEGFGGAPTNGTDWDNFITGWAAGLKAISPLMNPGFYTSQSPISRVSN